MRRPPVVPGGQSRRKRSNVSNFVRARRTALVVCGSSASVSNRSGSHGRVEAPARSAGGKAAMRQAQILKEGLGFVEGPRWHEGRLWLSDSTNGTVWALDLDGGIERVVDV